MASGSCGAGLTTTVLPMASAGPTLPAVLVSGKLYDVMAATTPTGARRATPPMIPPGAERRGRHHPGRKRDLELLRDALRVAPEPGRRLGHLHLAGDPHGGAGLGLHQRHQLAEALVEQVGRPGEDGGPLVG